MMRRHRASYSEPWRSIRRLVRPGSSWRRFIRQLDSSQVLSTRPLQAAAATWHGPLRADRLMQAARACPERAIEHARAAWAADGELAERMLSEAQQHLEASELCRSSLSERAGQGCSQPSRARRLGPRDHAQAR